MFTKTSSVDLSYSDSTPSVTHQVVQVHSHSNDAFKHVSLSFAHVSYYRILVTHACRQSDSYVSVSCHCVVRFICVYLLFGLNWKN